MLSIIIIGSRTQSIQQLTRLKDLVTKLEKKRKKLAFTYYDLQRKNAEDFANLPSSSFLAFDFVACCQGAGLRLSSGERERGEEREREERRRRERGERERRERREERQRRERRERGERGERERERREKNRRESGERGERREKERREREKNLVSPL